MTSKGMFGQKLQQCNFVHPTIYLIENSFEDIWKDYQFKSFSNANWWIANW